MALAQLRGAQRSRGEHAGSGFGRARRDCSRPAPDINPDSGPSIQVAEAQRLLTQAEIDDALSHLAVWRALLALAAAAGDLQPFVVEARQVRLVLAALTRPITVVVALVAIALCAYLALQRMPVDIFPQVGDPAIYVAQPYGGMDPAQMEGYLTYYYEYHFLYITGIDRVESKSIQGAALMKLMFHEGTDMNQAMAETVGYVNRARAFMPPGTVPPFITRFDAGSVAVGQLIFDSSTHSQGELQDYALNRVRPLFATLPGVSAPPPFGGNQRTIVIMLDPDKLRQYRISPDEAIAAVSKASLVMPSGNMWTERSTGSRGRTRRWAAICPNCSARRSARRRAPQYICATSEPSKMALTSLRPMRT